MSLTHAKRERELTGRHVLFILLAFFGVMIAVNAYFTVVAVSSFRGEDVPRSYRQGLEYNQTLEARAAQAKLGWTVTTNRVEKDGGHWLLVQVQNKDGNPVFAADLTATLRHRTDTALDQSLHLTPDGPGRYQTALTVPTGEYYLKGMISKASDQFVFTQSVRVP